MLAILKIIKNKILLNLLRVLIILSILIITFEIADASNATVVYRTIDGDNTTNSPKIRYWDNSTSNFSVQIELWAAGNPNSPIRNVIVKQSPISSKQIIVTQSDNGNITAYITNNMTGGAGSWTQEYLGTVWLTAPAVSSRRFDVAFETSTGDALIVYAVASADGAQDLAYREVRARDLNISNGSITGEQYINDNDQSTDVQYSWVRLAEDPNKSSDDIVLVAFDSTDSDVKAWAWNGTNWTREIEITAASTQTAGFEANTAVYAADGSKGMVCGATGTTGSINCSYYNTTGNWMGMAGNPDLGSAGDDVQWLELKADPTTDDIMVHSLENGNDLLSEYWNGLNWSGTVTTHDGTVDNISTRVSSFFWNTTGGTGRLVWDTDTVGGSLNVSKWTGSWTSLVPFIQNQSAGTGQWMTWYTNPTIDSIKAIGIRMNATTLNLHWINWTGADPISSSNETTYTITTNVSSSLFESYNLAFQLNNTNQGDMAPVATLVDPANNNISSTGNITFIANASEDFDLINASLYTNHTGTWKVNQSILIAINDSAVTINGRGDTFNQSVFNISGIPDTVFIWSVQYCDDRNNCTFAGQNNTVKVRIRPIATEVIRNDTSVAQNDYVNFTANWTDDTGLSAYIFSINMSSTGFVNSTAILFSGSPKNANSTNVTQVTAADGTIVMVKFYANDTSGNMNESITLNFTVASANTAPSIGPVFPLNVSGSIVESGVSNISFSFNATDVDGADTLNDASSRINLTSPSNDTVRINNSCGQYGANLNTTTVNYTCVVPFYYFDQAGNWTIIASVADNNAVMAENNSGNFTLLSTLAVVIGPSSISFPSIKANDVNITSSDDPIYVNNTGNQNITANNVSVTPITLVGQSNPAFNLSAANFSVSNQTQAFNAECNATTPELANNTVYNIAETILPRGNNTAGIGSGNGVEQIYVCLRATPGVSILPAQVYSATGGAAWTISVV